ncbi:hypothetical protein N7478_005354 [Penicillium angulare]|uniref:uncharacterized protein n=1 Tax=Penicillium angulare TaxID=116970 RepID=UPI0025400E6E|nr:uncharacterized protein N7478_005354 [Penicillium angulare]KAJ5279982.1 hypothetical protein N7478_005354 [Penicillium angulare]
MAPKLELCFKFRGYISKQNTVNLGSVKSGATRVVIPITHGFIEGKGLNAQVLPGGGDWITSDSEMKVAYLDIRTQARTAEGHAVSLRYEGILHGDEQSRKVLGWAPDAKTTDFGDHQWFITPLMETSDPKMKWIEETMFMGQGHFVVEEVHSAVEYEIYKFVN